MSVPARPRAAPPRAAPPRSPSPASLVAASLVAASLAVACGPAAAWAQEPAGANPPSPGGVPEGVVRAQPRGFVVVAVPVPPGLGENEVVSFHVTPAQGITVVGSPSGQLRAGETRMLVTLSVPAGARAGLLTAATAVFRAGAASVEVPVRVDVESVRRVTLSSPIRLTGLYPGARIDFDVQVANAGNLAETVQLDVEAPSGWEVQGGETPLAIEIGASRLHTLRLHVPSTIGPGDFFLDVRVRAEAVTVAESSISLHVGDRASSMAAPGPTLFTALSGVAGTNAGAAAIDMRAQGPIWGDWSVEGFGTVITGESTSSVLRGLSRVGTYALSPSLRLWSPTSELTAGNVMGSFDELTGVNASGRGLTARHESGSLGRVDLLAARPQVHGPGHEDDLLLGVRYGLSWRALEATATATRLDADRSHLEALGLDLRSEALPLVAASGGVAYRRYESGSGVGLSLAARHDRPTRHLEVRAVHAPGGSRAFARAEDELSASASFLLTSRWSVGGSFSGTRDENVIQQRIESLAWSAFQQLRVAATTTARVEVRGSTFDALGGPIAFGAEELNAAVGVSTLSGPWSLSLNGAVARVERRVDQAPLGLLVTRAPQLTAWGSGGWSGRPGTFQVEFREQRSEPGTGHLTQQRSLGVTADRVPLHLGDQPVMLNAGAQYASWGSEDRRTAVVARAGATTSLPNDIALTLGVERDPFFTDPNGNASWVFSVRVEQSRVLPRLSLGSGNGRVFQDLNGNGERDAGEPGMANVTVRRSGGLATTDAAGVYRFDGPGSGPALVDVSSLPPGWLLSEASGGGRDIGLVPTSQVVVRLEVVPSPALALREPDLTRLSVLARDAAGREWLGRHTGGGQVRFDALPVGVYTLVFDAAAATEPLRPETEPVAFTVVAGAPLELVVPLVGRPLRFAPGTGP